MQFIPEKLTILGRGCNSHGPVLLLETHQPGSFFDSVGMKQSKIESTGGFVKWKILLTKRLKSVRKPDPS